MERNDKYDVVIIGSGPGGEKAAVQAAKLGKRVVVVEREAYLGGAGLHTGTIPSKTLRETALFLNKYKHSAVFGFQYTLKKDVALHELMYKKTEVMRSQVELVIEHFSRNGVEVIYGNASLHDQNHVLVKPPEGGGFLLEGNVIILAPGTRPSRPPDVPFDQDHIYDSDTILTLDRIPQSLTIVGAGVIGCEYASIFASLGVKVTLLEKRDRILGFADEEIVNNLIFRMRQYGVVLKTGEEVMSIEVESHGTVVTSLRSGKKTVTEKLLYTMGRVGNTDGLGLEQLGIIPEQRGLLMVNKSYQTNLPNIYAVGDVIGFPSLASTSREQGRRAVCHAFREEGVACELPGLLPYGVYTIPEIAMVGKNEGELTKESVPYEVGCAFFREVARGQIVGDIHGMLKIIFHRESLKILGVHIVGELASELIHIGQTAMNFGAGIDYFRNQVFNYPTLSDAYKQAAMNGVNKLGDLSGSPQSLRK